MSHHLLVYDADASDADERVDRVQAAVDALQLDAHVGAANSRNALLSRVAEALARGDLVTCFVDLSVGHVGSDRLGDRIISTLAGHDRLNACIRIAWTRYAGPDVIRAVCAGGSHALIDHRKLRHVPDDDPGWRAVLSGDAAILGRARGAHDWLPDWLPEHPADRGRLRDVYHQTFDDADWHDWMMPALLHIAAGRRDADILADPSIDIDGLAVGSGHRGGRLGRLRGLLQTLGPSLDHGETAARRILHRAGMLDGITADIGERIELDGKIHDWVGRRAPIRLAAWLTFDESEILDRVAERYADLKDAHRVGGRRDRPSFVVPACTGVASEFGVSSVDVRLVLDRALQKLRDARADYAYAPQGTVAAVIRFAEGDKMVRARLARMADGTELCSLPMPVVYRPGIGIHVGGRPASGWDLYEAAAIDPELVMDAVDSILCVWSRLSDRSEP